jgi:hypothetical protein
MEKNMMIECNGKQGVVEQLSIVKISLDASRWVIELVSDMLERTRFFNFTASQARNMLAGYVPHKHSGILKLNSQIVIDLNDRIIKLKDILITDVSPIFSKSLMDGFVRCTGPHPSNTWAII